MDERQFGKIPIRSKLFIGGMVLLAAVLWVDAFRLQPADPVRFLSYLGLAIMAAANKVRLPGVNGTISVYFLFTLLSIVELSRQETIVIACSAALVQTFWKGSTRPKLVRALFNVANLSVAAALADAAYHASLWQRHPIAALPQLAIAATVYFVANALPVAVVIAWTEGKNLRQTWELCYRWTFAYYLVGSAFAYLLSAGDGVFGWHTYLLLLPAVYVMYRSYKLYLDRLAAGKAHAEEIASLHLRTIETLALAIDAKDHVTHAHQRRVQVYAIEIGQELGLASPELDALRAAALLHDIGKLAVPEHIISKPGKLTPEEFEKMKIHPAVGAEILECVRFPYPVAPIVRSHHEKWNGNGYPDGLSGENIPIGARILAAVDCLDALASDRQYRRALPLDEAMQVVAAESGKSYDPKVVAILHRRYRELEEISRREAAQTAAAIKNNPQPPTRRATDGMPSRGARSEAGPIEFVESIAAARQELHRLFELTQDLGKSLSLPETLSVLAGRLKRMIAYDSIAIYIVKEGRLIPEFVNGEESRLLSSLQIPIGAGVSGGVAKANQAMLNGNPALESGYLNNAGHSTSLRSVLAVPLKGLSENVIGVMSLYRMERDAFTPDHLRVLLALVEKVSLSIENALKFRRAESSATTDYLTALPNSRSLFEHLDSQLSRCKRKNESLALLACDLDGFKQVNDRFGHLQGNKVLQLVAKVLRECCRECDYVARIGGDEFVVVLTSISLVDIGSKIGQLNSAIKNAGRQAFGEDIISLSVGSALYPQDGIQAESLLAEADRRMYLNKRENRSMAPLQLAATER